MRKEKLHIWLIYTLKGTDKRRHWNQQSGCNANFLDLSPRSELGFPGLIQFQTLVLGFDNKGKVSLFKCSVSPQGIIGNFLPRLVLNSKMLSFKCRLKYTGCLNKYVARQKITLCSFGTFYHQKFYFTVNFYGYLSLSSLYKNVSLSVWYPSF